MRTFIATAMLVALTTTASAADFRWASTTDPDTMDPHASNSAPVFSLLNNVYEGLVRRNESMKIEGSLAESWEPIGNGQGWRFNLRKGVKFHDGADFTAADVMFSYVRASSEEADTSSWFAPVSEVTVVDDFTIDFLTKAPNPIFPDSIANFLIMDSGWAEANEATRPAKDAQTFATLNANGTGPYRLTERQPGLKTVLSANTEWWGERTGNVDTATFTPIQNDATRVAALISGDVDLVNPVPVQDAARLDSSDGVKVIRGIEARVIMFGFDQTSDTLFGGADAGKPNPFKDVRVREAVAKAINVDAILQTIMRGSAEPASQLVSPAMRGYSPSLAARPAVDVDGAKALLAEAGYPDGFSFALKCPNDRYLNDESVCQAAVSMLAQVGLIAQLDAVPVSTYWPELREDNM
ncbi:MAG: ABC transporter substrate-binding protein, partial [Pseudomonadota bacterium]